jgi:hypothetical protein
MYNGRREFRLGAGFVILYVFITALFATGALVTWRDRGWTWVSVGLIVMAVLSVGAIVETFVLRIRLTDDALVVRDLRGSRAYAKQDIAGIAEAKGTPPSLRLRDGSWVRLPSVAGSLGNSVRAWLKS